MTSSPEEALCLHCGRRPSGNALGLCLRCAGVKGILRLYLKTRADNPVWQDHLEILAERARRRLPLFDTGE